MTQETENGTEPGLVADAVRGLEKELRAQGGSRWLRRLAILAGVAVVIAGLLIWRKKTEPPPPARFTTEKVEHRDILEQVQSTGTVKPLTEVQVGAQVSGRIVDVKVDFNSKVKKGDLLAEIDPSLFGAQVSQSSAQLTAAKASVQRAKAQLETARIALARQKSLVAENLTAASQVDQAQGQYDVAEADLAASKAQITQLGAQLRSARTTLAYTRIFSPIDGVVISRNIDPGQTVAASFSAPVLFVIAQDLSQMQVLADIDEADVGKLKEGMKAEVVVDAFPGEKFKGTVTQVRYSPNTVAGVVTYSAVVDVENPALKLRPGMTATVSIRTREAKHVLAVRNAALRFRPIEDTEKDDDGTKKAKKAPAKPIGAAQGRLYLVGEGPPDKATAKEKVVDVGITDGVWTELQGKPLTDGAEVITDQRDDKKKGFHLF